METWLSSSLQTMFKYIIKTCKKLKNFLAMSRKYFDLKCFLSVFFFKNFFNLQCNKFHASKLWVVVGVRIFYKSGLYLIEKIFTSVVEVTNYVKNNNYKK